MATCAFMAIPSPTNVKLVSQWRNIRSLSPGNRLLTLSTCQAQAITESLSCVICSGLPGRIHRHDFSDLLVQETLHFVTRQLPSGRSRVRPREAVRRRVVAWHACHGVSVTAYLLQGPPITENET